MYRIKLFQSEDLEEDERSQCKEYSYHYTYKDCVLATIKKVYIMLNRKNYRYIYCMFCKEYLTRLGCLPPWFTGDYSKVCNRTLSEEDIQFLSYSIVRHFDMDEYPECMRPCTRLNIRSRIMRLHSINSLPLNE